MKALILRPRVRRDIQSKVERILRELGHPEPPLKLEDVRALLDLDRSFFSGEELDSIAGDDEDRLEAVKS